MNSIIKLQNKMLSGPQVHIPTVHRFSKGIYSREITIPAGVCLVGAKHLTQHFFVISQGNCVINDGDSKKLYRAPYQGITAPGTKRAITALSETVFTTFHVTDETDIDKIECDIIEDEGLKIQNNSGGMLQWFG